MKVVLIAPMPNDRHDVEAFRPRAGLGLAAGLSRLGAPRRGPPRRGVCFAVGMAAPCKLWVGNVKTGCFASDFRTVLADANIDMKDCFIRHSLVDNNSFAFVELRSDQETFQNNMYLTISKL